ncbi:hypothetical protein GF342_05985 [Candidatus Woesearchaeota archaeon]|nr:hypothetical protein [Candidatus Woesearchaeota archaeon]
MKFAHIADCHLGCWREPVMRRANAKGFVLSVDHALQENVDFVIIAGDLFNSALPSIESIRLAVTQLKRLKDAGIPVYGIPGSHDFSPSGKSMIDVLESADLFVNVAKGEESEGKLKLRFTKDPKTGALITGIFGRRGGLDKYYYQDLHRESLNIGGFKIFVWHAALHELKPKGLEVMDAMSVSYLPKGFDYYAGGHVHVCQQASLEGHPRIVLPGPTFPCSFAEIEKLKQGSCCIVDNGQVKEIVLDTPPVYSFAVDCDQKTPDTITEQVTEYAKKVTPGSIVTLRFEGTLSQGKPSDIDFVGLSQLFVDCFVMKNTYKLHSADFERVQVIPQSIESIESRLIEERAGQFLSKDAEVKRTHSVLAVLSSLKDEAMNKSDFESRVESELNVLLDITE